MRELSGFALRFLLLFGLLAAPWPAERRAVGACFRGEVRLLLGLAFPRSGYHVEAPPDHRSPPLDTLVIAADRANLPANAPSPGQIIAFDSASVGWIPLAMLIALVMATPLPWLHRAKALLAGALATQVLVAATILVSVGFNRTSDALPGRLDLILFFANHLIVENYWFAFVPPLLLWAGWIAMGGHWRPLGERLLGVGAALPERRSPARTGRL